MSVNEKVLTRVKHMLAKAGPNSGASEAEAQACLLKAQKMMAEHGIHMSDIPEAEKPKKEALQSGADAVPGKKVWWKGQLAGVIGKNFRCVHFLNTWGKGVRSVAQVQFLGLKEDVELAVELYRYACEVIDYNAKQYLKKRKKEIEKQNNIDFKKSSIAELEEFATFVAGMSTARVLEIESKYPNPEIYKMRLIMAIKDEMGISINPSALKNDYIKGFISGLSDKFKEQVAANEWGLILRTDEVVEEAMSKLELKRGNASSAKALGDAEAIQAGYREGKSFGKPTGNLASGQRQIE
ncbi:hypothetical protein D3C74_50450 [compost metagenome]